jgi:hypothetical protein
MIKIPLSFTLILFCPILKAQDTTLSKRIPSHPYTIVYTELLPFLDGSNGTSARLGIEHAWNKNFSAYAAGGIYFEQGYMARADATFTALLRLLTNRGSLSEHITINQNAYKCVLKPL